jgi:hypothetical protein
MSEVGRMCAAFVAGALVTMVGTLIGGVAPIESIPLPAAAVATPVDSLTIETVSAPSLHSAPPISIPPIRATPLFVSTAETPIPYVSRHREALMRWYVPEPEHYPGGMH